MKKGFEQTRFGLIRKRVAILVGMEKLKAQVAKLLADLNALEMLIRVFDTNRDLEELPKRRIPPAYMAFRAEMCSGTAGGLATHESALLITL